MKVSPDDKYASVRNALLNALKGVPAGTRLLPERAFAERLGVSRHAIRRAVDNLVDDGILKRVAGSGVYVNRVHEGGTYKIACVVTSHRDVKIINPFTDILLRQMQMEVYARGAQVLPAFLHDGENPPEILNMADGIITACQFNDAKLTKQKPIVTYFAGIWSTMNEMTHIVFNNYAEGQRAAEYLTDLGHLQLSFIGDLDSYDWIQHRYQGVRHHTRSLELPDPFIINCPVTKPLSYSIAGTLIEAGVSAVVCANDYLALTLISVLHNAGINVPDDISVIGFDDIPIAASFKPPLTTIRQPIVEGAKLALDELFARIESTAPLDTRQLTLPGEVVTRLSCRHLRNAVSPQSVSVTLR